MTIRYVVEYWLNDHIHRSQPFAWKELATLFCHALQGRGYRTRIMETYR